MVSDSRPKKPRGIARVTFRAKLDAIRTELEQGWPVKAIFDRHIAGLNVMSYRQFALYVSALRTPLEPAAARPTATAPEPPAATAESAQPHSGMPANVASQPPRQFEWNPLPKKEDFI
jgi:hypothetical protein